MARHRRSEAATTPAALERVQVVRIPTRELVSVLPSDGVWRAEDVRAFFGVSRELNGSIVRVQAPASASDETVERVRLELEKRGAFVRMLPRAAGAAVVAREAVAQVDTRTAREVSMALVDEANTTDREGLRAIVTAALDAEGV